VAIKIQRPKLAAVVDVDIDILYQIASLVEKHVREARFFNLQRMCEEFERNLRKEIDFRNEASHIERFAENFSGDPTIRVPLLFRAYSTRRVITTEFIDGVKASDVPRIRATGLDPKEVAGRGATLVLKQIFEHGFFHADPHPGNILVLPGNVICFLDFGIMGVLSPTLKEFLVSILLGAVDKNPKKIVRALATASQHSMTDMQGLEYDVSELLEEFAMQSLREVNVGELLKRLTRLIVRHRIRILPGFYLLLKSLITIEGVGFSLDPDFRLFGYLEPFAKKILSRGMSPLDLLRGAYSSGREVGQVIKDLPFDVKDIVDLVKSGKVRIEFEHRGLEPMLVTHGRLVNRIVFAVILASLVIGSSLVVLAGIPPKLYDIPLLGVAGFVAAGVIAFGLLISMIVKKRM
jgi:ubiquinone biosynthesis protein